jgi:hypothetical protein
MSTLVLMYVFFDKNGDIKAITPSLDEEYSAIYSFATFPLQEVEGFLLAQKNTFDYQVKKVQKLAGTTHKLVKKYYGISYTRTLDSYLTKVEEARQSDNTIIIVNDTVNKNISIHIAREFKEMYEHGTDEEQENISDFLNRGPSTIHITKKNNPYYRLYSVTFTPRILFNADKLYFDYTGDYTNVSVYTKKLISGYGYKEKAE